MIHEMDIKVETGGKNNHLLLEQNKTAARAWLEDPQIQVQIILYNIIHIPIVDFVCY